MKCDFQMKLMKHAHSVDVSRTLCNMLKSLSRTSPFAYRKISKIVHILAYFALVCAWNCRDSVISAIDRVVVAIAVTVRCFAFILPYMVCHLFSSIACQTPERTAIQLLPAYIVWNFEFSFSFIHSFSGYLSILRCLGASRGMILTSMHFGIFGKCVAVCEKEMYTHKWKWLQQQQQQANQLNKSVF